MWQDDRTPNGFSVSWDGNVLYSDTNNAHHYKPFNFTVVATGTDTLVFTAYNNPAFTYLDDVSLNAAVPEPSSFALLGLGGIGLVFGAY